MTDNSRKLPVERALEIMVYAPIGFAMFAKDMLPPLVDQFVNRGKTRLSELQQQVENQLGQARILGQFAVAQGRQQVREGVGSRLQDVRQRGERLAQTAGGRQGEQASPAEPIEPPSRVQSPGPAAGPSGNGENGGNGARGDSSDLPIPDYDELSASQVVARLSGLDAADLEAVRAYEESQRQRKTILTKIEQLTG